MEHYFLHIIDCHSSDNLCDLTFLTLFLGVLMLTQIQSWDMLIAYALLMVARI
jgi:hypothetical protein